MYTETCSDNEDEVMKDESLEVIRSRNEIMGLLETLVKQFKRSFDRSKYYSYFNLGT